MLIIVVVLITVSQSAWVLHSDPAMPIPLYKTAVGCDNHSLYIFGGMNTTDGVNHNVHLLGVNTFFIVDAPVMGSVGDGQVFYSQINDTTMFVVDPNTYAHPQSPGIFVFDLSAPYNTWPAIIEGHPEDSGKPLVTLPVDGSWSGCLSSSETPSPRLYLNGGILDNAKETQVLNLDDLSWLEGVPSMKYKRQSHGCAVVEGKLWAIGYARNIEHIEVEDIAKASWKEIKTKFPTFKVGSSVTSLVNFNVVVIKDIIFVIGGTYDFENAVNTVYTIHTKASHDIVHLNGKRLPYPIMSAGAAVAHETIYVFGGYDPSKDKVEGRWMSNKQSMESILAINDTLQWSLEN